MAINLHKFLHLSVIALFGLTPIYCQGGVPGQLALFAPQVRGEPTKCTAGEFGPKCVDCGMLLTCIGDIEPVGNVTCSSINPSYNGCDTNGKCASLVTIPDTCQTSQDFKCTKEGLFPDVTNCRNYFYCSGASTKGVAYNCPPNYSFNTKTQLCSRDSCQSVDCSRSKNKYLLYPRDPSFLIFCDNDGKPYVFRCDDPTYQYSLDTLTCSFKCSREGRFPVTGKCDKYYECFQSGRDYAYREQSCPPKFAFNATSQLCELSTTCNPSTEPGSDTSQQGSASSQQGSASSQQGSASSQQGSGSSQQGSNGG